MLVCYKKRDDSNDMLLVRSIGEIDLREIGVVVRLHLRCGVFKEDISSCRLNLIARGIQTNN